MIFHHALDSQASRFFSHFFSASERLVALRSWCSNLIQCGPKYGYYPQPAKSWLIVKPEKLDEARRISEGTGVKITTEGERHLEAVIWMRGTSRGTFMKLSKNGWMKYLCFRKLQQSNHKQHTVATLLGISISWLTIRSTLRSIRGSRSKITDNNLADFDLANHATIRTEWFWAAFSFFLTLTKTKQEDDVCDWTTVLNKDWNETGRRMVSRS